MPYIGHEPTNAGNFYILDDFNGLGQDGSSNTYDQNANGTIVNYKLMVAGVAITPNVDNLIVTIDGVLQHPTDAYSISGSILTFTEAPASGVDFHVVIMGQSATVGEGSIGADELEVSGDGTDGQLLKTDGDGTFSWINQNTVTASTANVATHVTVADNESTNENNLLTFVEDASGAGNVGLESDGDLHYNPSTGKLTATQLAGTLQTAAQTNITSVGTLTTLTVDNININGNDISSTNSDGDILFKGNDGGSTITALTLDMSDAGSATFNNYIVVNNNQIYATNGSAGAPSYAFWNDGDTGMWKPASNQLAFGTGGTQALIFGGDQSATFASTVQGTILYAQKGSLSHNSGTITDLVSIYGDFTDSPTGNTGVGIGFKMEAGDNGNNALTGRIASVSRSGAMGSSGSGFGADMEFHTISDGTFTKLLTLSGGDGLNTATFAGAIKSTITGGHVQIDNGQGTTVAETMAAKSHAWQNIYNVISAGAVSFGSDSSNSSHVWFNTYDTGSKFNVSSGYGMDMYHSKSGGEWVVRMGATDTSTAGDSQSLVNKFHLNKDGKLGLGTNLTPTKLLHLYGDSDLSNEALIYFETGNDGHDGWQMGADGDSFRLNKTGTSTIFLVNPSTSMNMYTTNLTMDNTTSTTPAYLALKNTGSTGYTGSDVRLFADHSNRGAGMYTHSTGADDEWFWGQRYQGWGRWSICWEGQASFSEDVAESPHELLYVDQSGNAYNDGNTWGSTSDERIKNSIVDANSQWDDIKALKIRNYKKDKDGKNAPVHIGVIAQELEAAGMNGLVDSDLADEAQVKMYDRLEEGDSIKTVKYSILYMKAIKALQEAMERIEALENA